MSRARNLPNPEDPSAADLETATRTAVSKRSQRSRRAIARASHPCLHGFMQEPARAGEAYWTARKLQGVGRHEPWPLRELLSLLPPP